VGKIIINGGKRLQGELQIDGAKNAVLPVLSASILNGGINIIENCPKLKDVETVLTILAKIGCKVDVEKNNRVIVDSSTIHTTEIPEDLATEMRSSIIFLGPLLARFGNVTISYPGGCVIISALLSYFSKAFSITLFALASSSKFFL
jgi:UDP-N-acetylglucosamine enolpyruvyl transferase